MRAYKDLIHGTANREKNKFGGINHVLEQK